ncbi:MAG: hypothetical protein ACI924_001991, partial [Flavobacterium sp.]
VKFEIEDSVLQSVSFKIINFDQEYTGNQFPQLSISEDSTSSLSSIAFQFPINEIKALVLDSALLTD